MYRRNLSPVQRIAMVSATAFLSANALSACGSEPEGPSSCYAMPYGDYSPAVTEMVKDNTRNYSNVTNRVIAAMVVHLGVTEETLVDKFEGWNSSSSVIRSTIGKKYADQGLEISPSDLPRNTDFIAVKLLQKTTDLTDGGRILAHPDGTKAFQSPNQLNSYTHNTGGFAEIDCITLKPIKTYG